MEAMTQSFISEPKASVSRDRGPSGRGCNATVFPGIEPGTAVKLGNRLSDAWLLWATHCMTTPFQTPWMPKVYGLVVWPKAGKYQALCEEYEHAGRGTPGVQCDFRDLFKGERERDEKYRQTLREAAPGLLAHLKLAHFNAHKNPYAGLVRVDLHSDNWMRRRSDGQLIVNDPSHISLTTISQRAEVVEIVRARAERSSGRIVVRD